METKQRRQSSVLVSSLMLKSELPWMSGFATFKQRWPTWFRHPFHRSRLHVPPSKLHTSSLRTFEPAHPVQIMSANPSLPPLSSFAAYNVPHIVLHVLPSNSVQPPLFLQSNLYVLPPTDFAANPSYYPRAGNPQIHSTFKVGESSAHSNLNVQASSSGIAYQQLEELWQQIAAIKTI